MNITHAFGSFSVDDLEAAKAFYGDVLGLTVKEEGMMGLSLELDGGPNFFMYPKDDHLPAEHTVLNFIVDDVDAAVAELQDKGVVLEDYGDEYHQDENLIARGIAAGVGPDIAWFKDPAGNTLAVLQPE